MRRYKLLIAGLLMVGAGGYLIFSNPSALPLWFVWLAGPLLWYLGIAVSIGGVAFAVFLPVSAQEAKMLAKQHREEMPLVLNMRKFDLGVSPAGLAREIPAMGGFIM